MESVSVAIPSWNGRRHLAECLEALRAQLDPGVRWEILVHDNGSDDGTAALLRDHGSLVRVTRSPENIGFAAACNRLAEEAHGEAVAFLNNDTRPRPGWLGELVATLADADVAAAAGAVVDWEGERLDFGRGVMTFDGHAFQLDQGRPVDTARVPAAGEELSFACGANMIVRRAVFREIGGFDADYFAYLEDVDLGWRLWSAGHRVVAAPAAIVHHRLGATATRLPGAERALLVERNAYATAYKNYDAELWGEVMPAVLLTLLSRARHALVSGDRGGAAGGGIMRALSEIWPRSRGAEREERALIWSRMLDAMVSGRDRLARRRRAVQARRVRSDRRIFDRFDLHVVPTYPGDRELFASDAFGAWLPPDLPIRHAELDELIASR